jgi:hypothetical protein
MGIPVGKWSIDLYNKMSNLCIGTCLLEPNIYNIYQVLINPPTSNNISVISWRSVLLVEKTGEPRENHRPVVSH